MGFSKVRRSWPARAAVAVTAVAAVTGTALAASGNLNLPFNQQGNTESATGSRVTITDSLVTYNQPLRITRNDFQSFGGPLSTIFDKTPVTCHGGRAHVTWHIGDLEPTTPDIGISISLWMNQTKIGGLIRGGPKGVYDDAPSNAEATVTCPAGQQMFYAKVDAIDGSWGIPYAVPQAKIQRGIIVEEVWDPASVPAAKTAAPKITSGKTKPLTFRKFMRR